MGVFNQSVVLVIFGLEMLLLLNFLRPAFLGSYDISASKVRLRTWLAVLFGQQKKVFDWVAIVMAVAFFLFYLNQFRESVKFPFDAWDVVNVWTKWAEIWFSGNVPQISQSRSYPQLIPMNWAICYAFMGSDLLQVFPKVLMGVFPFYILLVIVFLGFATKEFGYAYAVVGVALLLHEYKWFLTSGHVDIPVAFFGLLSISCLAAARSDLYAAEWKKFLFLGGVFAAGAALTKQSGFVIVIFYPVFAYLLIFKHKGRDHIRQAAWFMVWLGVGYCLLLAPWYVPRTFTPENFDLVSLAASGNGSQAGLDYVNRFKLAFFRDYFGFPLLLMCVALLNVHPIWRPAVWLIAAPWLLVSATFLGYDARNVALALPIFGVGAGMAVQKIFDRLLYFLSDFASGNAKTNGSRSAVTIKRIWGLPLLLAVLLPPAIILGQLFNDQRLQERELTLRKRVGYPEINERLYKLASSGQLEGAIVGNYMYMTSLPELKQRFSYDEVSDELGLLQTISNAHAKFLITMPSFSQQATTDRVVAAVSDRILLKLVFRENGFTLYEIHGSNHQAHQNEAH